MAGQKAGVKLLVTFSIRLSKESRVGLIDKGQSRLEKELSNA